MKQTKRILMLLSIFVLLIMLSACGGTPEQQQQPGQSGGESTTPEQSTGGDINVAVYGSLYAPIDVWDPCDNFDSGIAVLHNIYDTLLRYNNNTGEFTNLLAEDYSKTDDGLNWTFKIRQGAVFHDGTPVNAEAVKFSFERSISRGMGAAFIWDPVESFEVTDEFTLVMHLEYPAAMDLVVSSPYSAYVMSPTAVNANADDWLLQGNDAGSGPYTLESNIFGEQVVMAKFEDYWGGWEDNQFDKVIIQRVSESSTRRQMLESGEIDFSSELPVEDIKALESHADLDSVKTPSLENLILFMNNEKDGPLQNKLVRQAFSYAFPYDDIINYVMEGFAARANGPVPANLWGSADESQRYNYDIDKAKELMVQAGYPDGGFTLTLTYVTGDETERKVAELFQAELNKLGVTLDIRAMTYDMQVELGQSANPADRQDMALTYWWPDVIGPYTYLYSLYFYTDPVGTAWTYYNNPEFEALANEANIMSGIDRDKAADMFVDAQKILVEDAPAILVFDKDYSRIFQKSFGGYADNPGYPHVVFFYDCYRK